MLGSSWDNLGIWGLRKASTTYQEPLGLDGCQREREGKRKAILAQVFDPAFSVWGGPSGAGPSPSWGPSLGGRGVDVRPDGERLEQHNAAIQRSN